MVGLSGNEHFEVEKEDNLTLCFCTYKKGTVHYSLVVQTEVFLAPVQTEVLALVNNKCKFLIIIFLGANLLVQTEVFFVLALGARCKVQNRYHPTTGGVFFDFVKFCSISCDVR